MCFGGKLKSIELYSCYEKRRPVVLLRSIAKPYLLNFFDFCTKNNCECLHIQSPCRPPHNILFSITFAVALTTPNYKHDVCLVRFNRYKT